MLEGMDTAQVLALSRKMDASAAALDEIRGRVGVTLESLLWQGSDAGGFFEQWSNRFSGILGSAVSGLQFAASHLVQEVAQQEEASADGGGSSDRASLLYDVMNVGGFTSMVVGELAHSLELGRKADKLAPLIEKVVPDGLELGKVGIFAAPAEFVFDVSSLVASLTSGKPDAGRTDDAIVGTVLSGAETAIEAGVFIAAVSAAADVGAAAALATVAASPVVLVGGAIIGGVGLLDFGVSHTFDKHLNSQIVDGVGDAAKFVVKGDIDEVKAGVGAAKAVGSVVSSGVRGVASWVGGL